MKYRKFEAANADISLLGFGAMRMPLIEGSDAVDEEEAIKMIRYAIDNGVNYVDTAYVYHSGKSEVIVGKALADGYREKVFLATKLPFWICKNKDEIEPMFEKQLSKLNMDQIDMYLVHDINEQRLKTVNEWKIWDILNKKRDEGKIRYIGFSTHPESVEGFKEILDSYPWDFCQIQLNYMDTDIQVGLEGYEYAAAKGIPIIIMEPLKGGNLTDFVPPTVQSIWDSLEQKRSPADWAFRWVANLPGVLTILSGMSNMAQLEENIRILSDAEADSLTKEELVAIDHVADEYKKMIVYQCTGCKYCLPCAVEINIPEIMDFRNSHACYGLTKMLSNQYTLWLPHKASECIECGQCENLCPQHLDIMRIMKETAELYEAQ
jgi:Predicted oxidoreductases of the aldo/keto reductase family